MLARAASSMFWLARYIERMDFAARLMEAAQAMASVSCDADEWRSALIAAGCDQGFYAKYDAADGEKVANYLGVDRDNPSAILVCLDKARLNGRAMRTALTRDMWDAVNDAWLEARAMDAACFQADRLAGTLDWVKTVSTRFFGAYSATMLYNEIYWFTRAGTFLERADNTARILDVKYHVLLPSGDEIGGALDYYQWISILRAVSAVRAYQWIYRGEVTPWSVAELLILRAEMPRSLRRCYEELAECLDLLAQAHGGARGECHRRAGATCARLRYGRVADIFGAGLHEFLTDMIERTAQLGEEVHGFYMR
jgi:uncharacterized alpha-E superfamily protein